jgi:4-diphosphocytidyl-2-C-methyl-D-erythritol kinase
VPVVVRTPAKVNLQYHVGSRRPDGFHDVMTVLQTVSLYDEVIVEPASRLRVRTIGNTASGLATVPDDADNLAGRAAIALATYAGREPAVRITIHKRIPVAGGMAGGSADAAAALVACDLLWDTRLSRTELLALAAGLGSDVPFMLHGGTAVGRGRGELLETVPSSGPFHWVIVTTGFPLSTAAVYAAHSRFRDPAPGPVTLPDGPTTGLRMALLANDVKALAVELHSDIEPTALRLRPELSDLLDHGVRQGALTAIVSGTGPSCAFLVGSAADAGRLCERMADFPGCAEAIDVISPVPGIEVIG